MLVMGVLAVAITLAACGAAAQKFANVGNDLQAGGERAVPAAGAYQPFAVPSAAASAVSAAAQSDQRQIVKTGEVTIEVTSVPTSVGKVRALAVFLVGDVAASP